MKKYFIFVLLHMLLIETCLWIYFKNIILENQFDRFTVYEPYLNSKPINSNRVVLFVCDGLPANFLYELENNQSNAPFIRSIIEKKGSWGLSFLRRPTESLSGHLAIATGYYEDPLAVNFLGYWEKKIKYLDSIFNQTDHTFSWGYNKMLNYFEEGARHRHIFNYKYYSNWQDNSRKHGTAEMLDNWVKQNFQELVSNAKNYFTFKELIKSPKTIFFFHLIGMGTAAEAYKPRTRFYYNALRNLDAIINNISNSIEELFGDNMTTFIFTSDRGITKWGSSEARTSVEAITPIVSWGYGIKTPKKINKVFTPHEEAILNKNIVIPKNWSLNHLERYDLNQSDIAVLISTLLGTPIPVNSLGVLPVRILNLPSKEISIRLYLNALQLLQQFILKEMTIKSSPITIIFKPYNHLNASMQLRMRKSIERKILMNKTETAIYLTNELISKTIAGIDYYDMYVQDCIVSYLFAFISIVFILITGQILKEWSPIELLRAGFQQTNAAAKKMLAVNVLSLGIASVAFYVVSGAPISGYYFIHFLAFLTFGIWAIYENDWAINAFIILRNETLTKKALFYVLGVFTLMASIFEQQAISFGLFIISLWPFQNPRFWYITDIRKLEWLTLCTFLSLFPYISFAEVDCMFFKVIAIMFWIFLSDNMEQFYDIPAEPFQFTYFYKIVASIILANTIGISICTMYQLRFLLMHQYISFAVLAILLMSLYYGPQRVFIRFKCLSITVGLCLILLTLSYETFFPIILFRLMELWIFFEYGFHLDQLRATFYYRNARYFNKLVGEDIRRCYFFICFVFASFVGIGKVTSMNAFNTAWVSGFTTSSPLLIGVLIIIRSTLPVFLVVTAFRFVIHCTRIPSKAVLYLVLQFFIAISAALLLTVSKTRWLLFFGTILKLCILIQFIALVLLFIFLIVKYCTPEPILLQER